SLWAMVHDVTGHTPLPLATWAAIAIMLGLAVIFVRGFPDGDPAVRAALAFCLAWLISTPVYYPCYELMILPLLALMPGVALDWPVVGRTVIVLFGVVPGAYPKYRPLWISEISRTWIPAYVVKPVLLGLAVVLVVMALRRGPAPTLPE